MGARESHVHSDRLRMSFVWGLACVATRTNPSVLSLSLFPQFLLGEDVHEWGPPKGHADHEERNQKISTRLEEEEEKMISLDLLEVSCTQYLSMAFKFNNSKRYSFYAILIVINGLLDLYCTKFKPMPILQDVHVGKS